MLQEAKDLQNRAVSQMVAMLARGKKEYTVKAPTGSGKTYMMADFMNRILATHSNIVFLVSSLSKSDLAEQNYNSFCTLCENGTFTRKDGWHQQQERHQQETAIQDVFGA